MLTAPSLVCQRCSANAEKRSGNMPSTATGLSAAIIALPAASALSCTERCLSAMREQMVGKRVT